jgi:hypothetical protein
MASRGLGLYSAVFSLAMLYDDLFRPLVEQPALILPNILVAGDTWVINVLPDTEAPGGTATMVFASGTQSLSTDAANDNGTYAFTFAGVDTAKLIPGPYQWTYYVTDANANRFTQQVGGVPVVASPGSANWTSGDSFLTNALKEIEACILDLLNQRVSMVSFGGEQYYLWDLEKLWKMRNEIFNKAQLAQEELTGNKRSRLILPWFVNR